MATQMNKRPKFRIGYIFLIPGLCFAAYGGYLSAKYDSNKSFTQRTVAENKAVSDAIAALVFGSALTGLGVVSLFLSFMGSSIKRDFQKAKQNYDQGPIPTNPIDLPPPPKFNRRQQWRKNSQSRIIERLKRAAEEMEEGLTDMYPELVELHEKLTHATGRIAYDKNLLKFGTLVIAYEAGKKEHTDLLNRIESIQSGNVLPIILETEERIQKLKRERAELISDQNKQGSKEEEEFTLFSVRDAIKTIDMHLIEAETDLKELRTTIQEVKPKSQDDEKMAAALERRKRDIQFKLKTGVLQGVTTLAELQRIEDEEETRILNDRSLTPIQQREQLKQLRRDCEKAKKNLIQDGGIYEED